MPDMTIARQDGTDGHGRYVARIEGIDDEAVLVFTRLEGDLVTADHTGAPESMRGTGVAAALVDHLIADARAEGFRIVPLCPYVQARYSKHPEWQDVMTVAPGEAPPPRR